MRFLKTIAVLLTLTVLSIGAAPKAEAEFDVSFGFFYSDLSPHGNWLVSAEYGRVWQPNEYRPGWNPYYDGHWECSDVGWTWLSDYDWGAVPYHYGTWVLDPRFGWVWVPGYTWAPSWVVFRTGPDYIGWAPVPPGFSVGASITIGDDPNLFVVVGARDFLAPRVGARAVPIGERTAILQHTTIVNNISVERNVVVNRGPDVRVVEQSVGRRIEVRPIERMTRVAPAGHATLADLRVKPERSRGAVRAAEPVPESEPVSNERAPRAHDSKRATPDTLPPALAPPPDRRPVLPERVSPNQERGRADAKAQKEQRIAPTPPPPPPQAKPDSRNRPTPKAAPKDQSKPRDTKKKDAKQKDTKKNDEKKDKKDGDSG